MGLKVQCSPKYYSSIECRSVIGHVLSKNTRQDVVCSLEQGLYCKGQCFDYEIRLLCDCGESEKIIIPPPTEPIPTLAVIVPTTPKYETSQHCDPAIPNVEHPRSCSMFLQCERGIDGKYVYVEKNCGPGTMYNPNNMICDHAYNVKAIKPECGVDGKVVAKCPAGFVWSECAIPCKKSCHYYERVLTLNGKCTLGSNDCLPGCVPAGAAINCSYPNFWRDHINCVESIDCTCMGPNNELLKVNFKEFLGITDNPF